MVDFVSRTTQSLAMADFFSQIKPVTAGERLFKHLAAYGAKDLAPNRLGQQKFVRLTGRGVPFGTYLEGSMVAFAFKRVMKAAHGIFRDSSDRIACNRRLTTVLSDWFSWLDKTSIAVLVRDVSRAHDASDQVITKSIEKDIWRACGIHKCCFCGRHLTMGPDLVVKEPDGTKGTLEHVWPASLGGDSITENLIPACASCNKAKNDLFTWEQGSIHEFIYPIDFHLSDFLPRFPIAQRILLQRRAVVILAQQEKITLKQALLRVGPFGELRALDTADTWDIFNTQNHLDSLGEALW
jgi:5-methylcytosine-specific restriction endonuclease McrA